MTGRMDTTSKEVMSSRKGGVASRAREGVTGLADLVVVETNGKNADVGISRNSGIGRNNGISRNNQSATVSH